MFYIGCHVSSAGGYTAAATHADALGGSTFALFTRNPRGGSVKPLDEADMAAFSAFCRASSPKGRAGRNAPDRQRVFQK